MSGISRRSPLTSTEVAWRAVSPARHFLPTSRNSFALPDLYDYLEVEVYKYTIRLKANAVLQGHIALC